MTGKSANYAYLFEAKGIQRYILDSGPLRDLVGASDLVAGLASSEGDCPESPDLLRKVLDALPDNDRTAISFSRRASGAFMAHSSDRSALERLRALWRLTASLYCPGLEMSDVLLGDVTAAQAESPIKALKAAYDSRSAITFNSAAELPPTGHPLTAFNPRTGRLTTWLHYYANTEAADLTPVDVVTETQRKRADHLQGELDGVARKFLPGDKTTDEEGREYVFPRNLDPREGNTWKNRLFPYRRCGGKEGGDIDRRIAVVQADISGLGEAFKKLQNEAIDTEKVRAGAENIETMVKAAVRAASEAWLMCNATNHDRPAVEGFSQALLPARPIVLGGDDITVIVRADLALPFTQRLLQEIEDQGDGLSACAGVALVRAGQPFLMARALADDLCKFAKKTAKTDVARCYPSLIAFHNAGSTLKQSYELAYLGEMTSPDGTMHLTGNPYRVGKRPSKAMPLEHLVNLAEALSLASGRGNLVVAAQLLFEDMDRAEAVWVRWRKTANDDDADWLSGVDNALRAAGMLNDGVNPDGVWPDVAGLVSDALEWIDFGLVEALKAERNRAASKATVP